ncbi:MAG TPA: serine/threonine-protein kinase [Polyangia bacterium]|jgi:tetratricopeptide (TPR) repeat protein|nr:serine/threonine-protein kinase [Polyangia bacterium]
MARQPDETSAATADLPAGELARGTSIGRYVVTNLVGRGGMGEVYAAYDPQLDRRVALKILNPRQGSDDARARARLLREAKSLARLSHPNVVVLHDAGEFDGRVFLAMEFVDGETLEAWLKREARSWREIRDAFLSAARGLAAAHRAGLVHRDFKPQNVMVGRDGAIRVMDFGLARDASQPDGDAAPAPDPVGPIAPEAHAVALTRTGAILGTPVYMAPEQFGGLRADARTDQFAFCVALYHAFYGQRPFAGDNVLQIADAVISGRIRAVPARSALPAELRRAILRGLATDPAARFPSMEALAEALSYDPRRRAVRRVAGAAVAVMVLAGLGGARWYAGRGARLCRTASSPIAGIWGRDAGARRAATQRAFYATGASFAADAWNRVAAALDRYAAAWTAGATDACEATHVRGAQSVAELDLRSSCLRRSLSALRALTDTLVKADKDVVAQSLERVHGLPSIDRCADMIALRSAPPLPGDQAVRRRVEDIQDRLATVYAVGRSGRWADARAQVATLVDEAKATKYEPLVADVTLERGSLESLVGDNTAAIATLRAAFLSAVIARRDDLALSAATQLLAILGYHAGRHEEAKTWDDLASALLERLGPGHERDASALLNVKAINAEARGDFKTALSSTERAIELLRQADEAGARVRDALDGYGAGVLWDNLANQRLEAQDPVGALEAADRGIEIALRVHGPDHPTRAQQLSNRGEMLEALGRHDEARAAFEGALRIFHTYVPADDPQLAYPMTGIGNALRSVGRAREAVEILERALRLREAAHEMPRIIADTRFALARALHDASEQRPRARTLALAARDAYRAAGWTAQAAQVEGWLVGPLPAKRRD